MKGIDTTTAIKVLRDLQNAEEKNGFLNGSLWNDIQDFICGLENPSSKIETVEADSFETWAKHAYGI